MPAEKTIVGYEVTVRGQYQSASGKDRTLKTFGPVTFFLPEYVEIPNGKKRVNKTVDGRIVQGWEPQFKKSAVTVENVALYVVQRRLLPTWLSEHHQDAVTFRTCTIVPGGMKRVVRAAKDAVILDKPVSEMSLHELAAFCKMKGLNVPVTAFKVVEEAREAVQFEIDTQAGASVSPPGDPAESVSVGATEEKDPAAGPGDGEAVDGQDAADDLI